MMCLCVYTKNIYERKREKDFILFFLLHFHKKKANLNTSTFKIFVRSCHHLRGTGTVGHGNKVVDAFS